MHTFAEKRRQSQRSAAAGSARPAKASPARSTADLTRIPAYSNVPVTLQPRLTVSTPADRHEQAADRIASQVLRIPEAQVQRACTCGGACPTCQAQQPDQQQPHLQPGHVQDHDGGMTVAPAVVHAGLRSPGQPLDTAANAFFAPRFGHDFSQVRVHTDPAAAQSAQAVQASAYTVGRDIVFAAGQYAPHTASGRRLLAHELAHVTQQGAHAPAQGAVVQRDKDTSKTSGGATTTKARANTAASAPKLDFKPSVNGPPCACLVFIHNDERNARLTAELMHQHCAYNLAIIAPDAKSRRIKGGASFCCDAHGFQRRRSIPKGVCTPVPSRNAPSSLAA